MAYRHGNTIAAHRQHQAAAANHDNASPYDEAAEAADEQLCEDFDEAAPSCRAELMAEWIEADPKRHDDFFDFLRENRSRVEPYDAMDTAMRLIRRAMPWSSDSGRADLEAALTIIREAA